MKQIKVYCYNNEALDPTLRAFFFQPIPFHHAVCRRSQDNRLPALETLVPFEVKVPCEAEVTSSECLAWRGNSVYIHAVIAMAVGNRHGFSILGKA
jgi:hypothetical protein